MMKYDKFDLTGKVALCAGGSSGLGYQFARAMASAGADVAIVAGGRTACRRMQRPLRQSTASAAILITWT